MNFEYSNTYTCTCCMNYMYMHMHDNEHTEGKPVTIVYICIVYKVISPLNVILYVILIIL